MKRLTEKLWYSYFSEETANFGKEREEKAEKVIKAEEKVVGRMSAEEKAAFFDYEELRNEIYAEDEKNAFIEGVKFGASFVKEIWVDKK